MWMLLFSYYLMIPSNFLVKTQYWTLIGELVIDWKQVYYTVTLSQPLVDLGVFSFFILQSCCFIIHAWWLSSRDSLKICGWVGICFQFWKYSFERQQLHLPNLKSRYIYFQTAWQLTSKLIQIHIHHHMIQVVRQCIGIVAGTNFRIKRYFQLIQKLIFSIISRYLL